MITFRGTVLTIFLAVFFSLMIWDSVYGEDYDNFNDDPLEEVYLDESESESLQSGSDFTEDSQVQLLPDLYVQNLIVQAPEPSEPEEEPPEVSILGSPSPSDSTFPALARSNNYLIRGRFGDSDCWLSLPLSARDTTTVIENRLVNLGSSNITGRIFYSDLIDLSDYELDFLVLTSQYSTNLSSQLYNYQYPSYLRHYFLQNGRITYSDTYGLFEVVEEYPLESTSFDMRFFELYIMIVFFLGAHLIISTFKRYR